HRRRDGSARGSQHRGADALRHAEGRRSRDGHWSRAVDGKARRQEWTLREKDEVAPVRVVTAVHDPPVWTLPASQVRRITAALPDDEVIDARSPEERLRAFPDADVIVTAKITADEVAAARNVRWIQSTAVGVDLLKAAFTHPDLVITNVRGVHAP